MEHAQSLSVVNQYFVCFDVEMADFQLLVHIGIGSESARHPHVAFEYWVSAGGGVGTSEVGQDDECYFQRVALVVRRVISKAFVEDFRIVVLVGNFVEKPFAVESIARRIVGELNLHLLHRNGFRAHFIRSKQSHGSIDTHGDSDNAVATVDRLQILSVPALSGISMSVNFNGFPDTYKII